MQMSAYGRSRSGASRWSFARFRRAGSGGDDSLSYAEFCWEAVPSALLGTEFIGAALFGPEYVRAARLSPEYVRAALFGSEYVRAARLSPEYVGAALLGSQYVGGIVRHSDLLGDAHA